MFWKSLSFVIIQQKTAPKRELSVIINYFQILFF